MINFVCNLNLDLQQKPMFNTYAEKCLTQKEINIYQNAMKLSDTENSHRKKKKSWSQFDSTPI